MASVDASAKKPRAKKGAVASSIEALVNALQTAIVISAVIFIIATLARITVETRPPELWAYGQQFIYAPGGFHAVDELTGRTVPLSVESAKFTDATLDAMMANQDNRIVGAQLVLTDKTTGETKSAFWNKRWYEIYAPLIEERGSGSAKVFYTILPVTVHSAEAVHPGTLAIYVVMPS